MPKFLVVSPRPGREVARAEYEDFVGTSGYPESDFAHYVLDTEHSQLPALDSYAGILVGGSPFNVTTAEYCRHQLAVHEQLNEIVHSDVPSFFVCFGAGLTQHLRGGDVGTTHPEEAGLTTVELCAAAADDPITAGLPPRFLAMTGHKENVVTPAAGSVVLARGPHCPVHLVRSHDHSWSSQFHPEMDAAGMKRRMGFYKSSGYFAAEDFARIAAELDAADVSESHKILRNFLHFAEEY